MAKKNGTYELPTLGTDEVWMVNPHGALHVMKKDAARPKMKFERGWRPATADEIGQYEAQKGLQRGDKPPIAPPVELVAEPGPEL